MPYPTEHSARVKDPGAFDPNSFRSKSITTGVRIIMGKLKGQSAMTAQAYRFSVSQFTAEAAKKWLKDHDISYISFEPASKEPEMKHFGIPGMHWGTRRGSSSSSRPRAPGGQSEDSKRAQTIKKKKIKDMSNEELRAFATRMQLERQYKDLNQSSFSKGQKIVAEVLVNSGKQIATKYTTQFMDKGAARLLAHFKIPLE